jgi:N-acetyl-alpha-D-glucosaminyl L-malate synthase BshA
MRVLLVTQWGTGGGISTHVTRLIENSKADFDIITYSGLVKIPLFRAFFFVVLGFINGIFKSFDIIHAHYALPQGFLGLLLKYFKRRPLIITVHGSDITLLSKNSLARPIIGFVLKKADRVVAVSSFLKDEIKELGVPEEKIEVIYGGVAVSEDKEPFEPAGRVIAFVGSLVPQKGIDVLIEAFKEVKTEDATLVIVGSGPERRRLEVMATDNIRFLGRRKGIKNVLEKSDLLVLPSKEEGFGLALLEAMAAGVPVVATNVGGIGEIVEDGQSGILVEKDNQKQLAEAIDRVLADGELAKTLVENGLEKAKEFTWEKMGGEIDGLYEVLGARA